MYLQSTLAVDTAVVAGLRRQGLVDRGVVGAGVQDERDRRGGQRARGVQVGRPTATPLTTERGTRARRKAPAARTTPTNVARRTQANGVRAPRLNS